MGNPFTIYDGSLPFYIRYRSLQGTLYDVAFVSRFVRNAQRGEKYEERESLRGVWSLYPSQLKKAKTTGFLFSPIIIPLKRERVQGRSS